MPSPLNPASASGFVRAHGEPYAHLPLTAAVKALLAAFPDCGHTPKGLRRGFERLATEEPKPAQKPAKAVGKQPKLPEPEPPGVRSEGGNLVVISPVSNCIQTLEQLLAASGINPDEWEVERFVPNAWTTHAIVDRQPVCLQNHQAKAWLKPVERVTGLAVEEIATYLRALIPRATSFRPKPVTGGYLLVPCLFDQHFGKLCDAAVSGTDYNVEIAAENSDRVFNTLMERAKGFPIERVLFVAGNDLFNSDTITNTTTKGTQMHEAAHWRRVFTRVTALVIDQIERCRQRGWAVDVVIVPGNHDWTRAQMLGDVIAAWFRDTPGVTVDNTPRSRKYYQFGSTSLMFDHGSEVKEDQYHSIFTAEQPRLWADTRYRFALVAHKHHLSETTRKVKDERTAKEYKGLTVHYCRPLTPTDEWHDWKGFIGGLRGAEAFVYSRTTGPVAHFTTII